MGRPKEFNRDELLERATQLFRRYGFTATSTQQLVEGLGINRKSLYAEFGSKQGLFEAVLARYDEVDVERSFGPLETSSAGLADIIQTIEMFADGCRGDASGLGCLLCNTAVECAASDPAIRSFTERYIRRLTGAFRNALENARRAGEIASDVDSTSQARFLTSAVLGMAVLMRAKAAPIVVESSVSVVLSHLKSLGREMSTSS